MGEKSDQIEQQIQEKRNQLSENFNELEQKVKDAMDWRTQFQQRPGTLLAVAFGGGVLVSALFPPGRMRSRDHNGFERAVQSYPKGSEVSGETKSVAVPANTEADFSRTQANLEAVRTALVGVAISRAAGLIEALLPGFQREFQRAKEHGSSPAH